MKKRVDQVLVEKGHVSSRAKAQRIILAGWVLVGDQKVDKPGTLVDSNASIRILGGTSPYVSRGGIKLEHALQVFGVRPEGKVVLDIGISTGGFTDCLLQQGAKKIYGVDVGYGQLDWRLRTDSRVILRERTNARTLSKATLYEGGEAANLAVMDVSFISVLKIFPVFWDLLVPPREVVSLIKPQFEAGREKVQKGGLVKDPAVHQEVLEKIQSALVQEGWEIAGVTDSPIRGGEGNQEFFLYIKGIH